MKKDIFLCTQHHTGSWFVIDLMSDHPAVNQVFMQHVVYREKHLIHNKRNLIHMHATTHAGEAEGLAKTRSKLHDHQAWHYETKYHQEMIGLLSRCCHTIVSTRDPVRSLISRHSRHPGGKPYEYMIRGWVKMVTEFPKMFVLPVDLLIKADVEDRRAALNLMFQHCELEPHPKVAKWAEKWPKRNPTEYSPDAARLLRSYRDGDMGPVEKAMPFEIKQLRDNADVLAPFFLHAGYGDLPWMQ